VTCRVPGEAREGKAKHERGKQASVRKKLKAKNTHTAYCEQELAQKRQRWGVTLASHPKMTHRGTSSCHKDTRRVLTSRKGNSEQRQRVTSQDEWKGTTTITTITCRIAERGAESDGDVAGSSVGWQRQDVEKISSKCLVIQIRTRRT
jgi:hypothetical protein